MRIDLLESLTPSLPTKEQINAAWKTGAFTDELCVVNVFLDMSGVMYDAANSIVYTAPDYVSRIKGMTASVSSSSSKIYLALAKPIQSPNKAFEESMMVGEAYSNPQFYNGNSKVLSMRGSAIRTSQKGPHLVSMNLEGFEGVNLSYAFIGRIMVARDGFKPDETDNIGTLNLQVSFDVRPNNDYDPLVSAIRPPRLIYEWNNDVSTMLRSYNDDAILSVIKTLVDTHISIEPIDTTTYVAYMETYSLLPKPVENDQTMYILNEPIPITVTRNSVQFTDMLAYARYTVNTNAPVTTVLFYLFTDAKEAMKSNPSNQGTIVSGVKPIPNSIEFAPYYASYELSLSGQNERGDTYKQGDRVLVTRSDRKLEQDLKDLTDRSSILTISPRQLPALRRRVG